MKITPILKLDKNSKKSPIFIRLRDRFDGEDFQSTINAGFRKLTNGYINKLLSSLGSFLHYGYEMGYILRKPKFKLNGTPKQLEKPFLRRNEVLRLFNSDKFDYKDENNWISKGFSVKSESVYYILLNLS